MTTGYDWKIYANRTSGFTYYKPGANFSGAYVELVANSTQGVASGTTVLDISTSGGQITVHSSYSGIDVEINKLFVTPSGSSGLTTGDVGVFELATYQNVGSDARARIDGTYRVFGVNATL